MHNHLIILLNNQTMPYKNIVVTQLVNVQHTRFVSQQSVRCESATVRYQ